VAKNIIRAFEQLNELVRAGILTTDEMIKAMKQDDLELVDERREELAFLLIDAEQKSKELSSLIHKDCDTFQIERGDIMNMVNHYSVAEKEQVLKLLETSFQLKRNFEKNMFYCEHIRKLKAEISETMIDLLQVSAQDAGKSEGNFVNRTL